MDITGNTPGQILEVEGLKVHFPIRSGLLQRVCGAVKAVDGVSFSIAPGETFGVVGESGCGKSTIGNAVLRIIAPTSGQVRFLGQSMDTAKDRELFELRKHMAVVFQDPVSALNPKVPVGESVSEPLLVHEGLRGRQLRDKAAELLEMVGLQKEHAGRFPHEFSGGQRQRLVIARALALSPELIVCDEPVSALDVSVQSQVLNLMVRLQKKMGMSYMFISHDLSVVRHISDRVVVVYLGKIVEQAPTAELFDNPLHPYTKALMSAIPVPDPVQQRQRQHQVLHGELPSPANQPSGCAFHQRCPDAMEQCSKLPPKLAAMENAHMVSCHLY
jgi:oligopeptide/dipeptide ABC transporter ATP-binding protein